MALLAKWDDFKILCKALTLENQCFSELVAEAKKLREQVAKVKKTDAAEKSTFKGLGNEARYCRR